jgi:ribonucleotide reductase alpha subunit
MAAMQTTTPARMFVVKRNGSEEPVHLDKITKRLEQLCEGPGSVLDRVDPVVVSTKVITGLYTGVTTVELDNLAVETAAALILKDPQYGKLAARVAISNLHKQTPDTFSQCIQQLHDYEHPITKAKGVIDPQLHETVMANAEQLNAAIVPYRDYNYTLFGFKTLERAYLLKCDGMIVERPGYMLMRVAIGIHGTDLERAIETYDDMSLQLFTHATPSLFNAGTKKAQMSSCFLLGMEDSIAGIYKTLTDSAFISQHAGGIGINIHDIRAAGSHIAGTGGTSNGLVPMLRVFNDSARFVDQVC